MLSLLTATRSRSLRRTGRLYDTEEAAGETWGSIYVTGMLMRFAFKFDFSLTENQIIKEENCVK